MEFRWAQPADAAELSAFMKRMFVATFTHYPEDQLLPYLLRKYSPAIQLEEINHPKKKTLLGLYQGKIAAYCMVILDSRKPEIVVPDPVVEIQRFYVDSSLHGKGIAKDLMIRILSHFKDRTVWLGVYEKNFKAQRFYEKMGFRQVGQHLFAVGNINDVYLSYLHPSSKL